MFYKIAYTGINTHSCRYIFLLLVLTTFRNSWAAPYQTASKPDLWWSEHAHFTTAFSSSIICFLSSRHHYHCQTQNHHLAHEMRLQGKIPALPRSKATEPKKRVCNSYINNISIFPFNIRCIAISEGLRKGVKLTIFSNFCKTFHAALNNWIVKVSNCIWA